MNSDPDMVKLFVTCLQSIFNVPIDRIQISIRIFEDLNRSACLQFWSEVTGVPSARFSRVDVKFGHKSGKLPYGMCRVRVLKGGDLLKLFQALKYRYFELVCPRSSMDRAEVS